MQDIASKIVKDLKEQILLGLLSSDKPLPSENELSEKYGVSRVTVQKALNILASENYIYTIPGKGSFIKEVSYNQFELTFDELVGFDVQLLSVDILPPPPEVIYYLHVHPSKKVIRIRRIGLSEGVPAVYDEKFIPYTAGAPIIEQEIGYSLFPDFVANLASPYEITRKIHIAGVAVNADAASFLKVSPGMPIICVDQQIEDQDSNCIGWGKLYYLPSYFSLEAHQS